MLGQTSGDATSDVVFAIAISAGGVAVATIVALFIRAKLLKKQNGKKGEQDGD